MVWHQPPVWPLVWLYVAVKVTKEEMTCDGWLPGLPYP